MVSRRNFIITSLLALTVTATQTQAADSFDAGSYYRLTTMWQGAAKSLDIVNDGTNNKPRLAKTGDYSGQYWKITKIQ